MANGKKQLRNWVLIDTPQYQMDFIRFNVDLIVPSGRTITKERLNTTFPCRWDATPANFFTYYPTNPHWKEHLSKDKN